MKPVTPDQKGHPGPLILGTMARRGDDPATRIELYQRACELGINAFDTAPLYGFGVAERLLGEALAPYPRERMLVLGKVGLRWDAGDYGDVLFEFEDRDGRRRAVRKNSRPESVVAEVEQSLQRLGTDYLDLVQIHHPDPHTPIGDTMSALEDLQRAGKVRAIGVSNFSLPQIEAAQAALRHGPLYSLQSDYSLLQRSVEQDILEHCRTSSLAFLAYSPLAGGLLARADAGVTRNRRLARALHGTLLPLAERHGAHPSAIALAWLTAQAGVCSAITGVSSLEQLEAQVMVSRVRLTADEVASLSQAFAGIPLPAHGQPLAQRGYRAARRLGGRALRRIGLDPRAWQKRRGPRW